MFHGLRASRIAWRLQCLQLHFLNKGSEDSLKNFIPCPRTLSLLRKMFSKLSAAAFRRLSLKLGIFTLGELPIIDNVLKFREPLINCEQIKFDWKLLFQWAYSLLFGFLLVFCWLKFVIEITGQAQCVEDLNSNVKFMKYVV